MVVDGIEHELITKNLVRKKRLLIEEVDGNSCPYCFHHHSCNYNRSGTQMPNECSDEKCPLPTIEPSATKKKWWKFWEKNT